MSIADRIISRLREESVVRQVNTPPDLHPEPDPNRRSTLVLAGNYRQASDFAREAGWNRRQWTFIQTPEQFRGYDPARTLIICYGTWWDNWVNHEIYEWAEAFGFTIVQ